MRAAGSLRIQPPGKGLVYQSLRPVSAGDLRLAAALTARIHAIAAHALDALAPAHRTVASEIVVLRFVERFAAALATSDWMLLLTFVDASCERYAGILPVAALLTSAHDAVCALIASVPDSGASSADLASLRSNVERLATKPRLVVAARREAIDEVDVALDDLITRLDISDELTAEHSRAVGGWCARLAERLALGPQETIEIARCGLIHDIGKISTPPEILSAPRSLTAGEFDIMRRHAADGAAIVVAQPLIAHLMPAVRNHHERIDGRGYPDGLSGRHIPSTARIVCVADAFNAMIGRRPYRSGVAPAVGLERLAAGRGTQFDPDVVDAMIDVVTNLDPTKEIAP